jgi:hypothetical protein
MELSEFQMVRVGVLFRGVSHKAGIRSAINVNSRRMVQSNKRLFFSNFGIAGG